MSVVSSSEGKVDVVTPRFVEDVDIAAVRGAKATDREAGTKAETEQVPAMTAAAMAEVQISFMLLAVTVTDADASVSLLVIRRDTCYSFNI
jgi:hypothetical protein